VWLRAGVLGNVSDSTPLVIPFRSAGAIELTPGPRLEPLCAGSRPLPRELTRRISHWISQLTRRRKRPPAGHVGAAARPGIPPYLILLFLVLVFVSVNGIRRPYTCWCVYRVSWPHFVCASAVRRPRCASEGSRCGRSCLRHFCWHELRKFPCVGDSLSLGAVWALAPELEQRRVCVPFLDAGGHARPIPHVSWDAVVHRSWTAHHARNFGQVARVDALRPRRLGCKSSTARHAGYFARYTCNNVFV